MLLRLLLLGILGVAIVVGFRFWRRASSPHEGGISGLELGEIARLAKSSKRIEAAVILRGKPVLHSSGRERGTLVGKVDDSIRRLVSQEKLREEIDETLESI